MLCIERPYWPVREPRGQRVREGGDLRSSGRQFQGRDLSGRNADTQVPAGNWVNAAFNCILSIHIVLVIKNIVFRKVIR